MGAHKHVRESKYQRGGGAELRKSSSSASVRSTGWRKKGKRNGSLGGEEQAGDGSGTGGRAKLDIRIATLGTSESPDSASPRYRGC